MKLVEICFKDFRQFLGEQSFSFALSEDRPGNILFGANGSGKTTFLNGFTWVLYGSFSDDVEQKARLINNNAWKNIAVGDDGFAEVSLRFMHGGRSYKAVRRVEATKIADSNVQNPKASVLTLTMEDQAQVPRKSDSPQHDINTILPKNLAQFFFFNGERMENLIKNASYADVKKEVKGLLDLNQVERAAKESLPRVRRALQKDFKKEDNGLAAQIEVDIENMQNTLIRLRSRQEELTKNISANETAIAAIKSELKKIEQFKPLLDRQDRLELDIAERKESNKKLKSRLYSEIQNHGYLAFSDRLLSVNQSKIETLKESGTLPAPMSREFIARLLEEETCVCGTTLPANSIERSKVEQASESAVTTESTKFWQRLEARIPAIREKRDTFQSEVNSLRQQLHDDSQRLTAAEVLKAEIDTRLRTMKHDGSLEDSTRLQERMATLHAENIIADREKEGLKKEVQESEAQLSVLKNKRNAAQTSGEVAERILSRIKLVEELTEALEEIYANRVRRLLAFLNEKIKENYRKISHQNHEPYLSDEFEIGLKTGDLGNIEVGKSTGENQILTISFLAAVSAAAREQIKVGPNMEGLDPEEKEFPIVMDAAFGSLDEGYQTKVTRLLASISSQLVILVSKSQGQGRVDRALSDYASEKGIIVTYTTAEDVVNEEITIDGKNHPYVIQGDIDCSKIVPLEEGKLDV